MKSDRMGTESFVDIVQSTGTHLDPEISAVKSRIPDGEWLSVCPVSDSRGTTGRDAFKKIIGELSSESLDFSSTFSDFSRYLFVYSPAYRSAIAGSPSLSENIRAVSDQYAADPDADISAAVKYITEFVFDYGYHAVSGLSGDAAVSDENKNSWADKVKSALRSIITGSSMYDEFISCIKDIGKKSQELADRYIEWKSEADTNFAWMSMGERISIGLKYRGRKVSDVGVDIVGRIVGQALGTEASDDASTTAKTVIDSELVNTLKLRRNGSVYVTASQIVILMSADAWKFINRNLTNIGENAVREKVRTAFLRSLYYVFTGTEYSAGDAASVNSDIYKAISDMRNIDPHAAVARRSEFVSRVNSLLSMNPDEHPMMRELVNSDESGNGFTDIGKTVIGLLNKFFRIGGNSVFIGGLRIDHTTSDVNYADVLNKAASERERVELGYLNAEAAERLNDTDSGHGRGGVIGIDNGRIRVRVQGITKSIGTDSTDDSIKTADALKTFEFPFVIGSIYRDGCPVFAIGYGLNVFENVTSSGYSEGDLSTSSGSADYSDRAREIVSVFSDGTSARDAVKNKREYEGYISDKSVNKIIHRVFSENQDFLDFAVCISIAKHALRGNYKAIVSPLTDLVKKEVGGLFKLQVSLFGLIIPMITAPDAASARTATLQNFKEYLNKSLAASAIDKSKIRYAVLFSRMELALRDIDEKLGGLAENVNSKCAPYMGDTSSRGALYLAAINYPERENESDSVMNAIDAANYAQKNFIPAKYLCDEEYGTLSTDDFDTSVSAVYKYISKDTRGTPDETPESMVSISDLSDEDSAVPSEGTYEHRGLGMESGNAPYSEALKRVGQIGGLLRKGVNPRIYNTIITMIKVADGSMKPLETAFDLDTRYVAGIYKKFRSRLSELMTSHDYNGAADLCEKFSSGDMFFGEDNARQAVSMIMSACLSDDPSSHATEIKRLISSLSEYAKSSGEQSKYADFANDAMEKLSSGDYAGIAEKCKSIAGDNIGTLSGWNPVGRMYPETVNIDKISGGDSIGSALANYFSEVYFPGDLDSSSKDRGGNLIQVMNGCIGNDESARKFVEYMGQRAYRKHSEDNSEHLSGALNIPDAYVIGKFSGRVESYISNNYVPGVAFDANKTGKSYYIVVGKDKNIVKGPLFDVFREIFLNVISGNISKAMGIINSVILTDTKYPAFAGMPDSEVLAKIITDVTGVQFTGNVNELIKTLFDYSDDAGKLNADVAQVTWGESVNRVVRNTAKKPDTRPDVIPSSIKDTMADPNEAKENLRKNVELARADVRSAYDNSGLTVNENAFENRKSVADEFKKQRAERASDDVLDSLISLYQKMSEFIGFTRGSGKASVGDLESSPRQSMRKFRETRPGMNAVLKDELYTAPYTDMHSVKDALDGIMDNLLKDAGTQAGGMLYACGRLFDDGDDFAQTVRRTFGNSVQRAVTSVLSDFVNTYAKPVTSYDVDTGYDLPYRVNTSGDEELYKYDGKVFNMYDLIKVMFSDYCDGGISGKSIQEIVSEASKLRAEIAGEQLSALGNGSKPDIAKGSEKGAKDFAEKCSKILPWSLYVAVGKDDVVLASSKIIRDSLAPDKVETESSMAETYLDYVHARVDAMMRAAGTEVDSDTDADTVNAFVNGYIQSPDRPFELPKDNKGILESIREIRNIVMDQYSGTVSKKTSAAIWTAMANRLKSDFPGLKDEMLNEPAQLDDSRNQLMTAADVRLNAISESVKKIMSGSAVKKCSDDLLALSAEKKTPVIDIPGTDQRLLENDIRSYLPKIDPVKVAGPSYTDINRNIVDRVSRDIGGMVFASDGVPYAVSRAVWAIIVRYMRATFPTLDLAELNGVPLMHSNI